MRRAPFHTGVAVTVLATLAATALSPAPSATAGAPPPLSAWAQQGDESYLVDSDQGSDLVHVYGTVGQGTYTAPLRVDGSGRVVDTDVTYLVVGGGGAGGARGGGGGGGGVLTGTLSAVAAGDTFDVVVGTGGTAALATDGLSTSGGDSRFGAGIVAVGGGHGGNDADGRDGGDGGSGGGGGHKASGGTEGGAGTQGHKGGNGNTSDTDSPWPAGGGGGAGAAGGDGAGGGDADTVQGGAGGDGISSDVTGSELVYGGGGGGQVLTGDGSSAGTPAPGGDGDGGDGGNPCGVTPGVDGTGGGGGGGDTRTQPNGAFETACPDGTTAMPQDGGSGIVVFRMPAEGLIHVDVEAAEQVETDTDTEVTVTVQDVEGQPLSGLAVGLATDASDGVSLPAEPVSTDGDGVATFTVSSSVEHHEGLRLTVTDAAGTSMHAQTSIEVVAPPEPEPEPEPVPSPAPAPEPEPAPVARPGTDGQLPRPLPGGAEASVDGAPVVPELEASRSGVVAHLDGIRVEVAPTASGTGGTPSPGSGAATALTVREGGGLRVETAGLAARSTVRVWLFSTPTLLAELTTDDLGAIAADDLPFPEQVTSCAHTLQLVGRDAQGREVALALGLWVLPDPFPFVDVDLGAVAAPAIGCLAATGVVVGTGPAPGTGAPAFNDQAGATRGQAATMIARWRGFEVAPPETVGGPSGPATHADALAELGRRGMVRGFTDGTLRPAQELTRGQAASMLVAAAGSELPDPDPAASRGAHGPALDALAAAGALGDVGDGGVDDAHAEVTRAELALMLAVVAQFTGGGG